MLRVLTEPRAPAHRLRGAQPADHGYTIPTPAPAYGGYYHGHFYPRGCYRCTVYRRPGIVRRITSGRTGYTYRAPAYRYNPPSYRPYSPPAYRSGGSFGGYRR